MKNLSSMVQAGIKYFIMFAVVVLVQVLLLNHIQFSGYINPWFYILFILLLPVSTPRYAVLLLAFTLGMVVDIFSDTLGLHTAATVVMGYFRSSVIRMLTIRESEQSDYPGLKQYGFRWFFLYALVLIVIHHLFLFYLEVFTFAGFFRTFIRSIFSSIFTLFVIILSQYLVFRE